jgi:DNA-binding transcriptional MerR regulator
MDERLPPVPTPIAARQLGISARTLQRYARAGLITPALRLPSGQLRWDVEDLRRQLRDLADEQRERE